MSKNNGVSEPSFDSTLFTVRTMDTWNKAVRGTPDLSRACVVLAKHAEKVPESWGDPHEKDTFYLLPGRELMKTLDGFSKLLEAEKQKDIPEIVVVFDESKITGRIIDLWVKYNNANDLERVCSLIAECEPTISEWGTSDTSKKETFYDLDFPSFKRINTALGEAINSITSKN